MPFWIFVQQHFLTMSSICHEPCWRMQDLFWGCFKPDLLLEGFSVSPFSDSGMLHLFSSRREFRCSVIFQLSEQALMRTTGLSHSGSSRTSHGSFTECALSLWWQLLTFFLSAVVFSPKPAFWLLCEISAKVMMQSFSFLYIIYVMGCNVTQTLRFGTLVFDVTVWYSRVKKLNIKLLLLSVFVRTSSKEERDDRTKVCLYSDLSLLKTAFLFLISWKNGLNLKGETLFFFLKSSNI